MTNTHTDPAHADLLTRLFELNGDIDELIRTQNLRPHAFLTFAKDPLVLETLAALEDFQTRHQRTLARQHQAAAADYLNQATTHLHSPIEARRAATALARLSAAMLAPPKPLKKALKRPSPKPISPVPHAKVQSAINPSAQLSSTSPTPPQHRKSRRHTLPALANSA